MNQPSSGELNPDDLSTKASELLVKVIQEPTLTDKVEYETILVGMKAIDQTYAAPLTLRRILQTIASGAPNNLVMVDAFLGMVEEDINEPSLNEVMPKSPSEEEFEEVELGYRPPSIELDLENLATLATEPFSRQLATTDINADMAEDMKRFHVEINPDERDSDEFGISKVNKALSLFIMAVGRFLDDKELPQDYADNIDAWKNYFKETAIPYIKQLIEPVPQ